MVVNSYWKFSQVGHYCTWYCVFHWDWQDQMSGVMGVTMCKLLYAIKAATQTLPLFPIYSCWLTYDDGFIWAFIVPVIVIILVSTNKG